ncbi:MAG: hypothetical protein J6T51_05670 [Kiritimatiellae bacterium]|nr:hypothetical protein [Kiritimatiellia bacterium]
MLGGKTLPRRDFLRHAVMLAGAGVTAPLWAAMKYNRDAATRYFREQASETDARVNAAPSLNYWCTWSMQGMTRRLPEWRWIPERPCMHGVGTDLRTGGFRAEGLAWNGHRADGARVFARDIVGGVWHDITGALAYVDGETILPGDILAKIGREAAPADIHSAPGTLVSTRLQSQARQ